MSNNATICSLQDDKGFMWFGTKDGLNRFDGYSFKIYRNDPDNKTSIGNNFVHSLYHDANNILWVGTESGLYSYSAAAESFTPVLPTLNNRIRDINMDERGNLWFIQGFTLCRYNLLNKTITQYPVARYFEATSICPGKGNTIWVATSGGKLLQFNGTSDSFVWYNMFSHSPATAAKWIEKVYAISSGDLLIGTSNQGAKRFNPVTKTYKDILTYNPDKTEIFVRNFVENTANEFWIATETGIFIYNATTQKATILRKKMNDPYSIADNAIYSFCKDTEGGIWVGTYFGGVNYFPRQHTPFRKYFPRLNENSLTGNVVREMHKDKHGNLWIGTEDAGINKLNLATGTFTNYQPTGNKDGLSYTNIHGLLVTNNELWVGTFEHGLDIMNIETGKVIRHYAMGPGEHDLKSNFIFTITQFSTGEIIVGTTRGAYVYNRSNDNFNLLTGMPLANWYTCIIKDHSGIVWTGTYGNGINFYNTKTGESGNYKQVADDRTSVSSDRINSVFEDSKNNLWFATEGGLCRFNKKQKTFTRYTTKTGFPANFIMSILEDDAGTLWISSSKGLINFNPATEKSTVYTTINGLINDQFNFSAAYKDSTGTLYFGSVKGFISFNPAGFIRNSFVPPVYITSFQVFNNDLPIGQKSPLKNSILYTKKITLPHDQSTINIGFASLNYTAPQMSEYAFKMEGVDKNWTFLKSNRNAYFTNLQPGTYYFKVKATDNNGTWNPKEAGLQIVILPPWWASTWAYVFYLSVAVIIIYISFKDYHRRIEVKNKARFEGLRLAKEKEVFDAKMEFFTNVAHEIRTPLTLIKAPLEKVMRKTADIPDIKKNLAIMERNTNRLVDLTNQILDFRQTEIKSFGLSFTQENISDLLHDIFQSFKPLAEQKGVAFQLRLPSKEVVASIDLDAFNKILNNLCSNAIKYATSKVFIEMHAATVGENRFVIETKNDGPLIPGPMWLKVFEPFFRLKENQKQKGTGIGLAIAQSLVELHKGGVEVHTANGLNVFTLKLPIWQQETGNVKTDKPLNNLT